MNELRDFHRGDIVLIRFPYVTDPSKAKELPAVIVQNDIGNRYSSNLIVAAISSQTPSREYPFHFWVPVGSPQAKGTGLHKDSVVHGELIITLPKSSVTKLIGKFSYEAMSGIDDCLHVSLGLS